MERRNPTKYPINRFNSFVLFSRSLLLRSTLDKYFWRWIQTEIKHRTLMFSFCKICTSITLESWLDFVECKSPAGSIVCTHLAFGTKNNSDFQRHLVMFQDFGAKFLTFLGSKLGKYDMSKPSFPLLVSRFYENCVSIKLWSHATFEFISYLIWIKLILAHIIVI